VASNGKKTSVNGDLEESPKVAVLDQFQVTHSHLPRRTEEEAYEVAVKKISRSAGARSSGAGRPTAILGDVNGTSCGSIFVYPVLFGLNSRRAIPDVLETCTLILWETSLFENFSCLTSSQLL